MIGEGESEDGADRIQDSFVSVGMRTKRLKDRCIAYDMMTTLEIPVLRDITTSNFNLKWDYSARRSLLDHYSSITLNECKEWTSDLMRRGHKDKVENLNWLLDLIKNSCTQSMQSKVDDKFDWLEFKY